MSLYILLSNIKWINIVKLSLEVNVYIDHLFIYSVFSPRTKLFNLSFECGVFPDSLKRGRIIVLYKGVPYNDPANYRPISILSVFSQIFEKTKLPRLLTFLQSKIFFDDFQFGFRMKHSTEHACMTLLNFKIK